MQPLRREDAMTTHAAPVRPDHSRRTALLVMRAEGEATLCPFFGKCDGLMIFDPDDGTREFYVNTEHSAETMCELVLASGARRLVLGFAPGPVVRRLHAAEIDIRLGSCVCALEELAAHFELLPALCPTASF